MAPPQDPRIGVMVAERYCIDGVLGRGGMGVVYSAMHKLTRKRVAIKCLLPEYSTDGNVVSRFAQEARIASSFQHPNVIQVLDFGVLPDGVAYMVMELLQGRSLAEQLASGITLPVAETLELVLPLLHALEVAHRRGVLHRDLKPSNIFLSRDDLGTTVPKLLDFGVAKLLQSSSAAHHTKTGALLGTLAYMAPEQALGQTELNASTDVWSMGVVLYECLSMRLPFHGPTPAALLTSLLSAPVPSLVTAAPSTPDAIASVVHRALCRDRGERIATAAGLGIALAEAADRSGLKLSALAQRVVSAMRALPELAGEVPSEPSPPPCETEDSELALAATEPAQHETPAQGPLAAKPTSSEEQRSVERPETRRARLGLGRVLALASAVGLGLLVAEGRFGRRDRIEGPRPEVTSAAPPPAVSPAPMSFPSTPPSIPVSVLSPPATPSPPNAEAETRRFEPRLLRHDERPDADVREAAVPRRSPSAGAMRAMEGDDLGAPTPQRPWVPLPDDLGVHAR